ncbi:innexin inx1-like isoform X2 [Hyposmocoma kahamanoa]|uniref:innexin inx1-like isoform X2 n=1 Tax=Hyposmocoma kahamanoa TaxID=1477025 RepID=UPI000E6D9D22|nr:innexin inx1-like isoform X2 [Hyposmocoma kahamanoa]
MSTYVMPTGFDKRVGTEVVAPGVIGDFEINVPKKYYTYYQWACFVLFFQAIMCYIPRAIWKMREGGLLLQLAGGMNPFTTSEIRETKIRTLVHYMYMHQGTHNLYAFTYWFCELLCLVNVVGQMFLINTFLDGQFLSFGSQLLRTSNEAQEDSFYYYGAGGSIQNADNLCLLPQNVISEKVYIFLWFWYIILMVLLGILVIYRLVILLVPSARPYLLRARCSSMSHKTAEIVSENVDIGDWWLLYSLARNVQPIIYNELIQEFSQRMGFKIGLL